MTERIRLDRLLVEKGFYLSRSRAQAAIMGGHILVDGVMIDKPGQSIGLEANIKLKEEDMPFVSRGGLKLMRAVQSFGLDFCRAVVLDAGASTGGFTDVALKNGAQLVYAVDVGYGQLAWELRSCPRVVVMERTNIRHLQPQSLTPPPDVFLIDVSFISLRIVLPVVAGLTTPGAWGVCLIKPQFEAGREKVGKGGVVTDPDVHRSVVTGVMEAARSAGLYAAGLDFSPVTGPAGNIEYLLYLKKEVQEQLAPDFVDTVVKGAHAALRPGSKKTGHKPQAGD